MDSSKLRIAVIGCGSIGRRHLRNLRATADIELLACDTDGASLTDTSDSLDVETTDDMASVWTWGPDVIVVAAPTQAHVALATDGAWRDCHLFVEKPLSYALEGTGLLCDEIERRGLVSMVACNMRFHFGPRMVKRMLEDGAIGTVLSARLQTGSFLPQWRPSGDYRMSYSADPESGGAILDCIHEIDLALWYLGSGRLVAACAAPAESLGLEADGIAELILEHETGAISNVHLNFVQRDYRRTCQIIGSEGTIYWDMAEGCVVRHGPDGTVAESIAPPPDWDLNQMYIDEMSHFLDAVRQGGDTMNSVEQSLSALHIALEARQSARSVCV